MECTLNDLDWKSKEPIYVREGIVEVWKIPFKFQNESIAVKVMNFDDASSAAQMNQEAFTMASVNHPHIATIKNVELHGQRLYLILKYYEYGDLEALVQKRRDDWRFWSENELLELFEQLLSAFVHLESLGISHGDIKPQNIYVDITESNELLLFVGDLGCSRKITDPTVSSETVQGTPLYMSPILRENVISLHQSGKILKSHQPIKSDVFSLGLVFLYMSSLRCVKDLSQLHLLESRIEARVGEVNEKLVQFLLRNMLRLDEDVRWTFHECWEYVQTQMKGAQLIGFCKLCQGGVFKSMTNCGHDFWCETCYSDKFSDIEEYIDSHPDFGSCPHCHLLYEQTSHSSQFETPK